jgi:4'-phosphopantetheinyl transferase
MTQSSPSWHYPSQSIGLNSQDVHLWRAFLRQSATCIDKLTPLLSEDELSRAASFHFENDRERFILCRGILRIILGRYLDINPKHLKFRSGPYGKPYLVNESAGAHIQFNLTHSHNLALYAFTSNCMIGIDVEYILQIMDIEHIVDNSFSDYEISIFKTLKPNQKEIAFFNCWTRKEAYVKAIGEGLNLPLHTFDVSLAPNEPSRILSISGSTNEALLWSIETFIPAVDHVATVAIKESNYHICYYEWQFDSIY